MEEFSVLLHLRTQLGRGGVQVRPGSKTAVFLPRGTTVSLLEVMHGVRTRLGNPSRLEPLEKVGQLLGVDTPKSSFPVHHPDF
jgi:hypothetical protein